MGEIIDFFRSIGEFFSSVVDFIVSFFSDLAYVVQLLGEFVVKIPSFFSWLPSSLVAVIVTIFGVVVIYKVLGRD